jgi:hypothetical protein
MAKPSAAPRLSASLGEQARLAAEAAHRPVRPKPRQGIGTVTTLLIGVAFVGMGAFAAPTCILLLIGLAPSIVAYVVDRDERRMLTFTVAPLNLAGLAPYLLQLWAGPDNMVAVVRLLSSVYVWLVVYLAAGAGWLLFMGMPAIVSAVIEHSLDRRKAKLGAVQKDLRAVWGVEVEGGPSS